MSEENRITGSVSQGPGKPVFNGEILLCEDNAMNRELICSRLAKLGLTVITAENGEEGVERVKYRMHNGMKPFDLIFMDIYMPVMDGLMAAQRIHALKIPNEPVIIALTASSSPAEAEQYKTYGMPDCLNKPFSSQDLLVCLSRYLTPVQIQSEETPSNPDIEMVIRAEAELKLKLIQVFVKNNKNVYNNITAAISEGDIKLAHRLAHTIKGNAGLFGKTDLQAAAKNVEELLKEDENRINQAALDTFKKELDAVLEEFLPLVQETTPNAGDSRTFGSQTFGSQNFGSQTFGSQNFASQTFNPQSGASQLPELLDELEALLDGGDVRCLDLIDRNSAVNLRALASYSVSGVDLMLVSELIQHMEDYDFDAAITTLTRLRQKMQEFTI